MTSTVAELLAGVIRDAARPDITAIDVEPSGPGGWCRVRVGFSDGATVYVGVTG